MFQVLVVIFGPSTWQSSYGVISGLGRSKRIGSGLLRCCKHLLLVVLQGSLGGGLSRRSLPQAVVLLFNLHRGGLLCSFMGEVALFRAHRCWLVPWLGVICRSSGLLSVPHKCFDSSFGIDMYSFPSSLRGSLGGVLVGTFCHLRIFGFFSSNLQISAWEITNPDFLFRLLTRLEFPSSRRRGCMPSTCIVVSTVWHLQNRLSSRGNSLR